MIVGIAGHLCSGKDTLGNILKATGFLHVPLSDYVFREVSSSGKKPYSRRSRREFANQRRKQFGVDYFLKQAIDEVRESQSGNVVLSGIYCAGEALRFLERHGGVLVGIKPIDAEVRWERLRSRHDELRGLLTREEFEEADRAESAGEHDYEPNVSVVLRLANQMVDNSGDLNDLAEEVSSLLERLGIAADTRDPAEDVRKGDAVPIGRRISSPELNLDSFESNRELERQFRASQFIREFYSLSSLSERERALAPLTRPTHAVTEIGNQFAVKLVAAFLKPEPLEAKKEFQSIRPSTTDEELALLLNETEFLQCHFALHRHLAETDETLYQAVAENLKQAKADDIRQLSRERHRDLDTVLAEGITILVDPAHVERLRAIQQAVGTGSTPILEMLKSERILELSGFPQSKVSHAIHDAVDHGWLFGLLKRKELFDKYKVLFDSIGNPEVYGIFRREGEAVASIGFGVRYWGETQPGFVPLHSVSDIATVMERHFDHGNLEEIHYKAFRHIRRLAEDPSSRESQSLAFVFSNYTVELDEQRRKHGRIKVYNSTTHRVEGELDVRGPHYLSFFIEAHRELLDSHNKHRDSLLRVHIMVEEFLSSSAALEGLPFRIPVDQLADFDVEKTSLPERRINWMARHYGFTALREPVI